MQVKIGPIKYDVQYVEDLHDESGLLDGWVKHKTSIIALSRLLGPQRTRLVLWHEIVHAILTHAGFSDHDERMVDAIAGGVMSVLNENEWLREGCEAA